MGGLHSSQNFLLLAEAALSTPVKSMLLFDHWTWTLWYVCQVMWEYTLFMPGTGERGWGAVGACEGPDESSSAA